MARERQPVGLHADEAEEERRAADLPAREVEIEDAEAARVLREAQELGRAVQLRLALVPAVKRRAHPRRERLELIALRERRVRIGERRELIARIARCVGRHRPRSRARSWRSPRGVESRDPDGDAAARHARARARRTRPMTIGGGHGTSRVIYVRIGQLRMRHPRGRAGRGPLRVVIGGFEGGLSYDFAEIS